MFELKLTVEMPSRTNERHNVCIMYWNRGGVRSLSIVDSADVRTCVSGVFEIRSKDNRGSAHFLGRTCAEAAYCIYIAGEEPRIGIAIP